MSLFTGMNLNPERYAERWENYRDPMADAIEDYRRWQWSEAEIIEGEFEVIGEDALASGE